MYSKLYFILISLSLSLTECNLNLVAMHCAFVRAEQPKR